jgi:hypothetical protein
MFCRLYSERQPPLEVLKWGCMVNDELALRVWIRMSLSYLHAHWPIQHYEAARAKARLVYAMLNGESDTFEDAFGNYLARHVAGRERNLQQIREYEAARAAQQ